MKHLITSLTSAALLLALAGCTDVSTSNGAASPAKSSAASASASAQVKALCDSSVAKSKAGDVVGAKADINQAIANVARVKLEGPFPETHLDYILMRYPQNTPAQQQIADTIVAAFEKIKAGDPEAAKRLLDSLYFVGEVPWFGAVEEYTIIGDFHKARSMMAAKDVIFESAPFAILMGDLAEAKKYSAKASELAREGPDAYNTAIAYGILAKTNARIGDFEAAYANLRMEQITVEEAQLHNYDVRDTAAVIKRFQSNPTLCWGNPANPRRVAMGQVSKARCALALAQAQAGDMGAAKETLYFIIDEPDKIATEQAIAQAGAAFLQSGNVAKGIETLVVIPPAKQATAAQIRETIKTWLDIKNAKLAEMLAKLSPEEKEALKTKLELAILDCVTQADQAKTMSIMAAQGGQGDALALSELSNNYLNLQNVLKAVYKSLSEE